jgi:hypothetical protein
LTRFVGKINSFLNQFRMSAKYLNPSSLRSLPVLVLSLMTLIVTGCGGSPDIAPVKGKIAFKQTPVTEGTITFYPVAGGRPSTGRIQSDGSYELAYQEPGDGALVGEHKVAIEARKVTNAAPGPASFADELASEGAPPPPAAKINWLVPEEFSTAESSGLTAKVEDKQNVIDFNLP